MIACLKCRKPLVADHFNEQRLFPCASCGALNRVDVFPALFSEMPVGSSGEKLIVDEEAGCFYHPQKKAVVPCSACGRFLCALCDVELNEEHICLSCLETGKRKNKIKHLENSCMLYDNMALTISLIPMTFIFWFMVFFTAPAAIYMVIRYWKSKTSIIPRTKFRFVFAFLIAGFQLSGISILIFYLVLK